MKNQEIFDKHSDRRKSPKGKQRKDPYAVHENRAVRISFKKYMRELDDSLLEDIIDADLEDV